MTYDDYTDDELEEELEIIEDQIATYESDIDELYIEFRRIKSVLESRNIS